MATQASLARVQQLYVAYYGRPAETGGLEYWAARMDEEGEGAIINAFGTSAEYDSRFGTQTNAQAVNNLYNQMFNRNAEPDGLAYWVGVLERGEKSLAEIATTIMNAAGGIDRHVLNAKVAAAAEYTAEFGGEQDYNLAAAIAVVADADGGVYLPALTGAIEKLLAAEQAMADFLASADGDDDPETSTNEKDLRDNLEEAKGVLDAFLSLNQLNANLADAQAELSSVQSEIASIAGLRRAIEQYQAAEQALEDADEALQEANAVLAGRISTFNERNDGTVVVNRDPESEDFGTAKYGEADLIVRDANGNLVVAKDAPAGLVGVQALLADIQSAVAAQEAFEAAEAAFESAETRVETFKEGMALLIQLETAQKGVADAQKAIDDRAEAQSEVDAAQALVDEFESLEQAIEDAEKAIIDLGVDLNDASEIIQNDLYIFDAESGTFYDNGNPEDSFGVNGQDLIYVGDAYARVDLGNSVDLATTAQGQANALEIFFKQTAANEVTVYIETEAFQGNDRDGSFDGTTLVLTGVTLDELVLENGYITIA